MTLESVPKTTQNVSLQKKMCSRVVQNTCTSLMVNTFAWCGVTKMPISICAVQKTPVGIDKYNANRDQQWTLTKHLTQFDTLEDAKNFIRDMHRHSSEFITRTTPMPGLSAPLTQAEKDTFLEQFSFGDHEAYILHRRFLLLSDVEAFKKALAKQHKVLHV